MLGKKSLRKRMAELENRVLKLEKERKQDETLLRQEPDHTGENGLDYHTMLVKLLIFNER